LSALLGVTVAQAGNTVPTKNIVIVHGAFADGSGWEGVYNKLTKDGYNVTIVQNPTTSLAADVTATQNVLDKQDGPVVLVGHSYGGVVITEAGNDPKVKSLVYVAAYVPDAGQSVGDLLAQADKSAKAPDIAPYSFGADGKPTSLIVDRTKFPEEFAADVDPSKAQFMAASEIPIGFQTLSDKVTKAAWIDKPSYYIVSSDDQMIPSSNERDMAKLLATKGKLVQQSEIKASHAVFISHSEEVANMIEQAAKAQ
jgi:pimeloyl-ACP methyl ester carboxylesterase